MKIPSLKNFLMNGLLLGVTLLVCLIFLEIVVRVFDLTPDIFLEPNAVTGVWHIPNKHGIYFRKDIPKTPVQINSKGLRDAEYSHTKPAHTYRIAILGDSFTQAIHVPLEDTYQQQLEQHLNIKASSFVTRFEVINFGVGGFGTAQEYLVFRHHILLYHPDLVILAFTFGNDIFENSPMLNGRKYLPYLLPDEHGMLKYVPPAPVPVYMRFGQYWQSIPFVYYRLVDGNTRLEQLLRGIKRGDSNTGGIPFEYLMYAPEWEPAWQDAWNLTIRILGQLAQEVAVEQMSLLIMGIPDQIQVDPQIQQDVLNLYPEMRQSLWVWEKPNHLLSAFCQAQGLPYFDLTPAFQAALCEGSPPLYYHDDGHWNPAGHHLAAKVLYQQLSERGLQLEN